MPHAQTLRYGQHVFVANDSRLVEPLSWQSQDFATEPRVQTEDVCLVTAIVDGLVYYSSPESAYAYPTSVGGSSASGARAPDPPPADAPVSVTACPGCRPTAYVRIPHTTV